MSIGRKFRRLTRVIRRLEEAGWEISEVRPSDGQCISSAGGIDATIACRRLDSEDGSPPGPRSLGLEDHPVDIQPLAVQADRIGTSVELVVTIESHSESKSEPTHQETEAPLHRNPSRLARLYRRHRTFREIADSIEEDVSAETVRRYMIEHGIHEPGASTTGATRPSVLADGMGLPRPLEDVIDAVTHGNTVYDVQRELDLDRAETTSLLRDLDLIDLVTGRITKSASPAERNEKIRERLRYPEV